MQTTGLVLCATRTLKKIMSHSKYFVFRSLLQYKVTVIGIAYLTLDYQETILKQLTDY